MRIFKYTKHTAKILQTRTIRLSAANNLNDPFELSPVFAPDSFTPTRCAHFLRREEQIQRWFEKDGIPNGIVNYKEYRRHFLATIPDRVKELFPKIPSNVEDARVRFADTFSKSWLLFCASKRKDSILMWSHYADEHKGAVVEFDTQERPFGSLGQKFIVDVIYDREKALFDYDPRKQKKFESALLDVVRRKAPDWAYEQEVRAVFPALKENFPIPASCVKSVTFGCRCPESEKKKINELLLQPNFGHVSTFQGSLNKEEFKLDFELVKAGDQAKATL